MTTRAYFAQACSVSVVAEMETMRSANVWRTSAGMVLIRKSPLTCTGSVTLYQMVLVAAVAMVVETPASALLGARVKVASSR